MEENVLLLSPEFKLYKDRAVYLGTFIGGPLVAGYLIAENYKQLGQQEKAKKTWIIAIIATIIIFGGVFLIPGIEKIPNYLIPLIYTGIASYLVQHFQGKQIKSHVEQGGQLYSIWRAVLAGVIGLAIIIAIIFIVILLMGKEISQ